MKWLSRLIVVLLFCACSPGYHNVFHDEKVKAQLAKRKTDKILLLSYWERGRHRMFQFLPPRREAPATVRKIDFYYFNENHGLDSLEVIDLHPNPEDYDEAVIKLEQLSGLLVEIERWPLDHPTPPGELDEILLVVGGESISLADGRGGRVFSEDNLCMKGGVDTDWEGDAYGVACQLLAKVINTLPLKNPPQHLRPRPKKHP